MLPPRTATCGSSLLAASSLHLVTNYILALLPWNSPPNELVPPNVSVVSEAFARILARRLLLFPVLRDLHSHLDDESGSAMLTLNALLRVPLPANMTLTTVALVHRSLLQLLFLLSVPVATVVATVAALHLLPTFLRQTYERATNFLLQNMSHLHLS